MSIAAGLDKAEIWERKGEKVLLTFNSPFASTLVEKEFKTIQKIILDKLGWNIQFSTKIKREQIVQDETVEEQVELVRSIFRGTII